MSDLRSMIVTGGRSGIGRAIAEQWAARGATVFTLDVRPTAGEADEPSGIVALETDVTSGADLDEAFRRVHARVDRIEAIVSCAGIQYHEELSSGDPEKWEHLLRVNLVGAMRTYRAFASLLAPDGSVVIVSSVAQRKPYAYGGAYAASKAGLSAFAETLRLELTGRARVTLIAPGFVDTDLFSRGAPRPEDVGVEPLRPADVADAVEWALSRPPRVHVNEIVIRPRGQEF